MPDGAAAGSLRARLALAFVAVAVTAVAALAAVVYLETRSETKRLSDSDRRQAAGEVARALERAYRTGGSWADADSGEALALAAREDAVLVLRDAQGRVLLEPAGGRGARRGAGRHAAVLTVPVTVGTQRVGTAELRFPGALGRDEQRLRSALGRAVLLGSADRDRHRTPGCRAGLTTDSPAAAPAHRHRPSPARRRPSRPRRAGRYRRGAGRADPGIRRDG